MVSTLSATKSLIILSKKIPWFGNHTGYEQLTKFIENSKSFENISVTNIAPKHNLSQRLIGKLYAKHRGWKKRSSYSSAAEFYFNLSNNNSQDKISHILYLEDSLPFLDKWQKAPKNLIGTIHLPPEVWTEAKLNNLRRLSSAIVLYQKDLAFWSDKVGKDRVKFIHYGVDIDFFHPSEYTDSQEKRILYAGHYLRNYQMLYRLISQLNKTHPHLKFDLLVPEFARQREGFRELENNPSVTWHQNLTDEDLRKLYQNSYLLLLPMNSSGANTAIVEALACGLPIVTTDVGGIRDYGGGDIFPVVDNNDDLAAISLIEKYLNNSQWHRETSFNCRQFAEQHLDWHIVTQKHLEAYTYLVQ